ncbi:MAG: RlmE family RNA methyltransferase [Alphaproteobacteria bacterium]|nr:RlmE family RNA methyltransferase [Alphaproteobacteria bacterium]
MAHRTQKTRVRASAQRSAGSSRWLLRQLNDPYVQRARKEGYRSRAAYKLLEIDDKHRLLKPGLRVLDLGSAPGGWAQVAAARGCQVVGVDLLAIEPIAGVTLIEADIEDEATPARLLDALGGPADLLLSDLAPSATGQRAVDRLRSEAMGEIVLDLAPSLLKPGGHALLKLLRGADAVLAAAARNSFKSVRLLRPDATRRESSEIYLLAQQLRVV